MRKLRQRSLTAHQRLRKTGTIVPEPFRADGADDEYDKQIISYLVHRGVRRLSGCARGFDVGDVFSFLQYTRQFSQPLNSIANTINTWQSALAAAERVFCG
jgi:ABC-type multidrug transport system fused ATPase/permease subunit